MDFSIHSRCSGDASVSYVVSGLRQSHGKLTQIMINKGMIQMKSNSRAFLKKDLLGHVLHAVMAYVDDLVIAGSAHMVKDSIERVRFNDSGRAHPPARQFPQFKKSGRDSGKNSQASPKLQHHYAVLRSSLMSCSRF